MGRANGASVHSDIDSMEGSILEMTSRKFDQVDRASTGQRILSVAGIATITYFVGGGGPIGSEPIMSAAGPLIGLPALVVYPLLVTLPYAYTIAELCSALPENGGFAVWTKTAFGAFWGFEVGYWAWVAGVLKGALLPGFLLDILLQYSGTTIHSKVGKYCIKALIAIVLAVPNLLGTRLVERSTRVMLGCVLVPALVFTVWGYAKSIDFEDLGELRHEKIVYDTKKQDEVQSGALAIQWNVLINTLFWSFDGVNMASVFAGEVRNPISMYPKALAIAVALTFASYILPLPAAVVTDRPNWTLFTHYSYPTIAHSIGGRILEGVIVCSSVCSVMGLFVARLFCSTYTIGGMAENELVPAVLATRNDRFESHHYSIGITLVFMLVLLSLDYDDLLPMTNAFSAAVQLVITMTTIRLRVEQPELNRPVQVPCGLGALSALAVVPTILWCYFMLTVFKDLESALILAGFVVAGLAYGVYRQQRQA